MDSEISLTGLERLEAARGIRGGRFARLTRWAKVVVSLAAVLYLGAFSLMYFQQEAIVFRARETQNTPKAKFVPRRGSEIVSFKTGQGDTVAGVFSPALDADGKPRADAKSRPTLLFFYGAGEYLAFTFLQRQFEMFRYAGYNVLIPDYVGIGLSSGTAGEPGMYATADAAFDYLAKRPDIDPSKIFIVGHSLGCSAAVDLATHKPAAGLVTLGAFTSLDDMARERYWMFPTSLAVHIHCDNRAKIGQVKCPTLIVHGSNDVVIPVRMSEELERAAGGKAKRVVIEGGNHEFSFALPRGVAMNAIKSFTGLQ